MTESGYPARDHRRELSVTEARVAGAVVRSWSLPHGEDITTSERDNPTPGGCRIGGAVAGCDVRPICIERREVGVT